MEGYGEIVVFAFLMLILIGVGSVAAIVGSLSWAFTESPRGRIAYLVALVLTLSAHAFQLFDEGPMNHLRDLIYTPPNNPPIGPVILFFTAWIVAGVPLVRWLRHRLGRGGNAVEPGVSPGDAVDRRKK